uniref:AP-3 complex subunit mu-2 n=1 Tax=Lygus hesperus TaxID=30085 RepID=A0A0A9VX20_LYGHE
MIKPPTISTRVMDALSSSPSSVNSAAPITSFNKIPWRKSTTKYTNNEIYFDIIEYINLIIDKDKHIVHSSLTGNVHTKCYLQGVPDITLHFVGLDNVDHCSLHHSVRISRFERDGILSLIPPDNEFVLLSYQKNNISAKIPININPYFIFDNDATKFSIHLSNVTDPSTSSLSITDVSIQITIPVEAVKVNATSKSGTIKEDLIRHILYWNISKLQRRSTMILEGSFIYDTNHFSFERPVITVQFEAKHYSISNVTIDGLVIQNVTYSPARGIRSTVRVNNFQIRT